MVKKNQSKEFQKHKLRTYLSLISGTLLVFSSVAYVPVLDSSNNATPSRIQGSFHTAYQSPEVQGEIVKSLVRDYPQEIQHCWQSFRWFSMIFVQSQHYEGQNTICYLWQHWSFHGGRLGERPIFPGSRPPLRPSVNLLTGTLWCWRLRSELLQTRTGARTSRLSLPLKRLKTNVLIFFF